MHATQRKENIWQYEGQIWNQLEKLQLEVSVWPYFYSFLDYYNVVCFPIAEMETQPGGFPPF